MNWFDKLTTAANDFFKTPFAQTLAGKPATTATAAKTSATTATWLWPVVIVGAVLVVAVLMISRK